MLQGTNVFVSTISITAIALDRFQVIVYPTKDSMKKIGGAAALIIIWIISFLMASPLILFSVLEVKPIYELDFYYCFCLEDPTLRAEKGAYSVVSMVVQYILPIIIVTIAHARICNKLKYRMANRRLRRGSYYDTNNQTNGGRTRTNGNRSARKRRTNALLTLIAVVFVLSWLPLNISNILVEFQFELFRNQGIDINYVYLICHTLVLSSACSNPVLYGWLNDNFQKEFKKMFQCSCKTWLAGCIRRIRGKNTSTQSNTEQSECTHDARTRSRRFTNTSQMFMMTDFDQSCPQSVLSL
ncbi:hypothetical protein DPMN_163098 [Dreissena polymorpha]|uniref:G-protein coupled receptors family 1 profile domain-containing protein n=2 Tax=Dreissena polymorpha TaxID=45954 RepID=A0A9D4ISH5_DREPO|nr:hypothetical protein DPMN_163098 [Dreissena polymorpha]